MFSELPQSCWKGQQSRDGRGGLHPREETEHLPQHWQQAGQREVLQAQLQAQLSQQICIQRGGNFCEEIVINFGHRWQGCYASPSKPYQYLVSIEWRVSVRIVQIDFDANLLNMEKKKNKLELLQMKSTHFKNWLLCLYH